MTKPAYRAQHIGSPGWPTYTGDPATWELPESVVIILEGVAIMYCCEMGCGLNCITFQGAHTCDEDGSAFATWAEVLACLEQMRRIPAPLAESSSPARPVVSALAWITRLYVSIVGTDTLALTIRPDCVWVLPVDGEALPITWRAMARYLLEHRVFIKRPQDGEATTWA